MNWIAKFFKNNKRLSSCDGSVVFLDRDIFSKEEIEKIKTRMTPVFVEFSGRRLKTIQSDIQRAVIKSD